MAVSFDHYERERSSWKDTELPAGWVLAGHLSFENLYRGIMGDIPQFQSLLPSSVAFCPVMDRRQFASMTGLTMDTVEAMIGRGYLPCIRIGKRSLINIALLQQRCIEADFK